MFNNIIDTVIVNINLISISMLLLIISSDIHNIWDASSLK